MVDNGSITNAVTLNPQTFAIEPYNNTITTPGRYTKVSPRVDYQLGEKHTLMLRYGITHSDVRDNGIGAFDLPARGYHSQFTNQTVQASDTALVGHAVNETRFQFYRTASQSIANTAGPEIQVLGSFNDGGSQNGRSFDSQNNYELQNYTSLVRGRHSWRFGVRLREQTDDSIAPQNFNGTFTFGGGGPGSLQSIERYQLTLLDESLGYSPAQIRAMGGGATQFSMNAGTPELTVSQFDAGLFAGDEWRARPNLTISLGLRYETQSNIGDRRDIAPRVALAWAPGATAKSSKTKTVIRAGFGMFYDRFGLANTLTARRFNGMVQQQYVVTNPDFFPNVPAPASPGAFQSTQVIQEVSSQLRAPYIMQSALTLERCRGKASSQLQRPRGTGTR
jgi:outer membrane receptor for ferrienterochelin and colicin